MTFRAAMLTMLLAATAGAAEEIACETLCDSAGRPVRYAGNFSAAPVKIPTSRPASAREMRGVWVATIENIDFGRHTDAASFRKEYLELVGNLKRANFNAIFFQVRPNCDAFYASRENPWSRWLTGTEGLGIPAFDPMTFMTEEAHKHGLEFHAWLNPYRVNASAKQPKDAYLKTLDPTNFARRHPELVLQAKLAPDKYSLLLNPAEPEVIRHIVRTVMEIVVKYPVDAIHFDDYFYLYDGNDNIDNESFRRLNPRGLALAEWRRSNVDQAILSVKLALNEYNRETGRRVAFGISPFGIWANRRDHPKGSLTGGKQSFFAQYADTRSWVKNGWVDYIVPQLYWPFGHEVAAYAALADWWAMTVRGTPVALYIGHSPARLGSAGWSRNELADQMRYNAKHPEIAGSVFFSYRRVFRPENPVQKAGVGRVLREYWNTPAAIPRRRNLR